MMHVANACFGDEIVKESTLGTLPQCKDLQIFIQPNRQKVTCKTYQLTINSIV